MIRENTLKIWKQLLADGCYEAAAGLLCDLFRLLDQAEQIQQILKEFLDSEDVTGWFQSYRDEREYCRELTRSFARDLTIEQKSGLWLEGMD